MFFFTYYNNTPKGIRIPVTSVKGKRPKPLDDEGFLTMIIFMSYLGIEPRTFQLKAEYSTIELVTHTYSVEHYINLK